MSRVYVCLGGWFILTVREGTAKRVKGLAEANGLTVDELINELMFPFRSLGWSVCSVYGAKVKAKNLHEPTTKDIPKQQRKTGPINRSNGNQNLTVSIFLSFFWLWFMYWKVIGEQLLKR